MSNAGAAGARAHRFGLAFQGASALSIHGKDTHTLTALKMTLRLLLSEVLIIWERPAVSEFAPGFRSRRTTFPPSISMLSI